MSTMNKINVRKQENYYNNEITKYFCENQMTIIYKYTMVAWYIITYIVVSTKLFDKTGRDAYTLCYVILVYHILLTVILCEQYL